MPNDIHTESDDSAERFRVFVYGTLREGGAYHGMFLRVDRPEQGSRRIATRAWLLGGRLYDTGSGYPALVLEAEERSEPMVWIVDAQQPPPRPGPCVLGEVYEVDQSRLRMLDRLEGYQGPGDPSNLYERIDLPMWRLNGGETRVLTYVFRSPQRLEANPPVGPDWLSYAQGRPIPQPDRHQH